MATELKRNLFQDVFRILTPEEIGILTTVTESVHKQSLVDLLTEKCLAKKKTAEGESENKPASDEEKAKEVAEEVQKDKVEASSVEQVKEVENVKDEEVKEVSSKRKKRIFEEEEEEVVEEMVDLTSFILDEQKKTKELEKKIKKNEIYKNYQDHSKASIGQQKVNKNDLGKSANIGILINKKRY
jgi:hypothetical protein